jgi:fructoselysine-6-P-deglycase FrlB-like protein
MSHVADEIASQPTCWARVIELAGIHARVLPSDGERVAVVGCGTSWFMAQAYASLREGRGKGETDAFPASEVPIGRPYDRLVAISRSGTTTEVAELLDQLRSKVPTVAVTADAATPVVAAADEAVILDFADEQSVVQTRFATTTLMLFRSCLGDDVNPVMADAEKALAAELDPELVAAEQITFLGRGWTVGLAHEAALKLREAAGAWAESYPAMEYRHGPISITGPRRAVWIFGPPPIGLADEVAATGGRLITSDLDPLADLIRAQRLAIAIAESAGLDPDNPRHLTRSVILPSS